MLALRVPAVRALALHACVVRTCAPMLALCVRAARATLAVRALCAFVLGVWCACAARLHRATLVDVADRRPRPPDMPFTHTHSHRIALVMHCSSLFVPFLACAIPPFLPHSLLVLFLPIAMRF